MRIPNLESLVIDSWDEFSGSSNGGMTVYKLTGRIENLYWEPPILSFIIERHGGLVLGSTRAEKQKWELNLDTRTADFSRDKSRTIKPRQKPLDVKPKAKEIFELIINKKDDECLKWKKDGSVRILINRIYPERSAPKQTVEGRRKRFRVELERLLTAQGWEKTSHYNFKPPNA